MHHSSIKEHLSKIHPNVTHSSSNPAYIFNSIAVPDPEQFNSASFDRQAFITEARIANEKLVAQINNAPSQSMRPSSSVNVSPVSHHSSSLNSTENGHDDDLLDVDSWNISASSDGSNKSEKQSNVGVNRRSSPSSGKFTSFSIQSIMNGATRPSNSAPRTTQAGIYSDLMNKFSLASYQSYFGNIYNAASNSSSFLPPMAGTPSLWPFTHNLADNGSQMGLFFTLLNQLHQQSKPNM